MIVIGIESGVFLIVLCLIISVGLCPEKSLAHLVDGIGNFGCYKLYWTVGSIVLVIIGGSEGRNVAASGSPASHGGKPRRKVRIFSLEPVRRVVSLDLQVILIGVFPLNKKIFTRNITVRLLLKFNNTHYSFIKRAINK
jgi:hypothetical protein